MSREDALSYLALGDSYTVGEGVDGGERWTSQLIRLLREDGISVAFPRTIAVTGWTCDELAQGMREAMPPLSPEYDLVSLLIGVNDQYREYPLEDYEGRFTALLDRAVDLARGRAERVFVLSIPDWGVTPFAAALETPRDPAQIAFELDQYNAAAERVCAERGVAFVDHSDISRALCSEPANLAADQLHPGAAVYLAWAGLARPAVKALLSA